MNDPMRQVDEDVRGRDPDIVFVVFTPDHNNEIQWIIQAVSTLLTPSLCIGIPSSIVAYGSTVSDGDVPGLTTLSGSAVLMTSIWFDDGAPTHHKLIRSQDDPRVAIPQALDTHDSKSSLLVLSGPELFGTGQLHMLMTELGIRMHESAHAAVVVDAPPGDSGCLLIDDGTISRVDGLILESSSNEFELGEHTVQDIITSMFAPLNFMPRSLMPVMSESHEQTVELSRAATMQVEVLLRQDGTEPLQLISGPRWLSLGTNAG